MIPLFRVEDARERGPYRHNAEELGIRCGEDGYRVLARNDNLIPTDLDEIFVFRSLELLKAWFAGDAEALAYAGFEVVTFHGHPEKIRDGLSGRQSVYLDSERAPRTILPFWEVFK